ncbi:MAG TPA: phage tail protein [Caulobacterales bacterium]|nr:phage tail protein [Caulobacterales bacterium]
MKKVIAIAAALWALTATAAQAAPLAAWIAGAIGFTGTAAAIAAAVIEVGLTAAASWAANKLFGPKKPKAGAETVASRQADVLSLSIGEAPRRAIFGKATVGGYLIDAYNFGGDYEWEALVIGLCDHDIEELVGYYIGDTFYPWPGDGIQPGFTDTTTWGYAQDTLEIQLVRGAVPGGFVQLPDIIISSSDGRWTTSDRMTGVTAVWVRYHISEQIWKSGRPTFKWVVKGGKWYDPRKDSSVPGGSGSHRWGVLESYEYTDNAEICRYNHERGVWTLDGAGGSQLMVGPGKSAVEAPPELIFARANLCDESVYRRDGFTDARYTVGCEVKADEPWIDVQNKFADAMAGDLVRRAAAIAVTGCAAEPISATFTDDDLVIGAPKRLRAKVPRDQLVNSVVAKFVDPDALWQEGSAPMRRSAADIASDGEERPTTVDLPFVTVQTQAQRIAEIQRRMARLMHTAAVVLGPAYMALEEGDWVQWTSARHFAGATKTFRCEGVSHGADMRTALALREINTAVYSWDCTTDELEAQNPAYLPAGAPEPLDLDGIIVTTTTATGPPRAPWPVIYVSWTPPLELGLRGVIAEVRAAGSELTDDEGRSTAQRTSFVGDQLLAPPGGLLKADLDFETDYEVRLIPVADPQRDVLVSAWRPIRTDVLLLGPVTGLAATPTPAGATLTWDQHSRPDVVGYDVRMSTDPATAWAEATVVDARWGSTSIFAPIATALAVTFFVRAIDRNGRSSDVSATVTTQVIAPGDVESFQAYPAGDLIRFTWTGVDGALDYEIRTGLDWGSGIPQPKVQGTTATLTVPMRREADALFWIKAHTAAGLYSANAYLSVARQPAPPERNEIITQDFEADGWPGIKFHMTAAGPDLPLELDYITTGVLEPVGHYFDRIDLIDEFYARCSILTRASALVSSDPTWADDSPWTGDNDPWTPILDDPGLAQLDAFISTNEADLPSTLTGAWPFHDSGEALFGGIDANVGNVSYGPCRIDQGVELEDGGWCAVNVEVPAVCSFLFEYRPTETPAADCTLAAFAEGGLGGHWMALWYDASEAALKLTDDLANEIAVPFEIVADDPMIVAIYQSGGVRALLVASANRTTVQRGTVTVAAQAWDQFSVGSAAVYTPLTWDDLDTLGYTWDDLAALGWTWETMLLNVGPAWAPAPGRFAEVEVHDSAAPAVAAVGTIAMKSATGFAPFRPFYAGDYRITSAYFWLRLGAPNQSGQALAISAATVLVDVPDVLDGVDNISIPDTGLDVDFARTFSIVPAVVANQRGGGARAFIEITSLTKTGFHVRALDAADRTTPIASVFAYAAKGY